MFLHTHVATCQTYQVNLADACLDARQVVGFLL